jgi:hypothetical protein
VSGRNTHFIASGCAERWIGKIVSSPVNGIADYMIETRSEMRELEAFCAEFDLSMTLTPPGTSKFACLSLRKRQFLVTITPMARIDRSFDDVRFGQNLSDADLSVQYVGV